MNNENWAILNKIGKKNENMDPASWAIINKKKNKGLKTKSPLVSFRAVDAASVEKRVLFDAQKREALSAVPKWKEKLGYGNLYEFCPSSSTVLIRKALDSLTSSSSARHDLTRLKIQILKTMLQQRMDSQNSTKDKQKSIEREQNKINEVQLDESHSKELSSIEEKLRLGEITPFEALKRRKELRNQEPSKTVKFQEKLTRKDVPSNSLQTIEPQNRLKTDDDLAPAKNDFLGEEQESADVKIYNAGVSSKPAYSPKLSSKSARSRSLPEKEFDTTQVVSDMCLAEGKALYTPSKSFKKCPAQSHAQKVFSPCKSFKEIPSSEPQLQNQGIAVECPICCQEIQAESARETADMVLDRHLTVGCPVETLGRGFTGRPPPQPPSKKAPSAALKERKPAAPAPPPSAPKRKSSAPVDKRKPSAPERKTSAAPQLRIKDRVECPECNNKIVVRAAQTVDEALAFHLNRCGNRRARSSRQAARHTSDADLIHHEEDFYAEQAVFEKGNRVEALWPRDRKWYKGTVESVKPNQTYEILYDDDSIEPEVSASRIRLLKAEDSEVVVQNLVVKEGDTLEAFLDGGYLGQPVAVKVEQNAETTPEISLEDEVGPSAMGIEGFDATVKMETPKAAPSRSKKRKRIRAGTRTSGVLLDDFDPEQYLHRLEQWAQQHCTAEEGKEEDEETEGVMDSSVHEEIVLDGGLRIPKVLGRRLFAYQRTGMRWLWELHQQGAGGIIGDEMGLGKTVQACGFLGCVARTRQSHGADAGAGTGAFTALVVCPASVLAHWLTTLHAWAPNLRTTVLHKAGMSFSSAMASGMTVKRFIKTSIKVPPSVGPDQRGMVLLTTYHGLKSQRDYMLAVDWDYVVLDEGQKIRNPDAEITLISKRLKTVHRILMTGTPIQNNLKELWSLFDFVFPGRLGTLPTFEAEFATPIRVGGYANASQFQVQLAYRCTVILRDLINPYLLRRVKKDIEDVVKLPKKTEQVLFCRLTTYQRNLYRQFLMSDEVAAVLKGNLKSFGVLMALRTICNHPDLGLSPEDQENRSVFKYSNLDNSDSEGEQMYVQNPKKQQKNKDFGSPARSSKMQVLQLLLPLWKNQGHRVLLFSQTRKMLNIIEMFVTNEGWEYGRLDGNTPVGQRQVLVDRFNRDPNVFIMLLTTRAGGVGINLIGADRVILFDPDWNPMTDVQARERAWRLGQKREVTVYRLICAGTLEEKIYHRQIFKTSITNRVLQDPRGRNRVFSNSDLKDLFTLGDDGYKDGITETADLFGEEGSVVPEPVANNKALLGCKEVALPDPHCLSSSDEESEEEDGERARHRARGSKRRRKKKKKKEQDDGRVLAALFEGAGLTGIFNQDVAEGEKDTLREMEMHADLAAKEALDSIKQSRSRVRSERRHRDNQFEPTWTGRHGNSASQQSNQRRFGATRNNVLFAQHDATPRSREQSAKQRSDHRPSFFSASVGGLGGSAGRGGRGAMGSQEILDRIRNRSRGSATYGSSDEPASKKEKMESISNQLHSFLLSQPYGEVTTDAILAVFKHIPEEESVLFRSVLRGMAKNKGGVWYLKPEFRANLSL